MEIDFIPLVVVQVWRVVVWLMALSLLGSFAVFYPRAWRARNDGELLPAWTLRLYAGVGLYLIQVVVSQMINWDQPVKLHGLPLTTIILACFVSSRLRRMRDVVD